MWNWEDHQRYLWIKAKCDFGTPDIVLTEAEAVAISDAQLSEPISPFHMLFCLGEDPKAR